MGETYTRREFFELAGGVGRGVYCMEAMGFWERR